MIEVITGALIGFGIGAITAVTGLIKNNQNIGWRDIDYKKALPTIIITGCVAAYMSTQGMALTDQTILATTSGFASVGITTYAENVIKGAIRYLENKFR